MGIEIYSSLDSTNDFAKTRIREGCPSGTVIWALRQTAGRGRRGRKWQADNSSLTFSVVYSDILQQSISILPLTIGLGLVQELQTLIPELKVKWPNDLWIGNKKLAGILGETIRYRGKLWVILGIGINVNISGEIKSDAWISLEEATGRVWPRLGILHLALSGVQKGLALSKKKHQELSPLFSKYGNFLHRPIIVFQGDYSWQAIAREVLPDGRLLVEDAQGLRVLLPEEISLRF